MQANIVKHFFLPEKQSTKGEEIKGEQLSHSHMLRNQSQRLFGWDFGQHLKHNKLIINFYSILFFNWSNFVPDENAL